MTMACITKTVSIYKEIPLHAQINISLEFFFRQRLSPFVNILRLYTTAVLSFIDISSSFYEDL